VSIFRGIGDGNLASTESATPIAGIREKHPTTRTEGSLGAGTLACDRCDAPVAIGPEPMFVTDELTCPYCGQHGTLRDFLSLAPPTRPARVEVRVVLAYRHPVR
jgi:hypothetical protein